MSPPSPPASSDSDYIYLAVEISRRLDQEDVERAMRNAEYLTRFTARPAIAAVAGPDIVEPVAERFVDTGQVLYYEVGRHRLRPNGE